MTSWPNDRPAYQSLAAAIQSEAGRWNVPGIAAGLWHAGRTDIQTTGTASIETGFPLTPGTLFQIGSISKIFTATLVMRLVEQGKLDLDTPVIAWLPDLPLADDNARITVTLRQLLSHAGGFEGDYFVDHGHGDDALTKAVAEFGTLRQWTPPGALWAYNNAGFVLAGAVVERVTGKPFETVMQEEIFKPLRLERTFLFPLEAMSSAHSVGHAITRETGPEIVRPWTLSRYVAAAGLIISCPADMLRFARLHLNNGELDGTRIISAASALAMRSPEITADGYRRSYGLGWAIYGYDGATMVDHGGSIAGFRAHLTLVPDRDFALIQLTNSNFGARAMKEIEAWALDHALGLARERATATDVSPGVLRQHAGTYTRHDSIATVEVDGAGLRLTVRELDPSSSDSGGEPTVYELEPLADHLYRVTSIESWGEHIEFIDAPAPDGTPQRLVRIHGRLAAKT